MNISTLSDRELLERIFATQIILMRKVYRIKDHLVKKYDADFVDQEDESDEAFEKLQADVSRLLGTRETSGV